LLSGGRVRRRRAAVARKARDNREGDKCAPGATGLMSERNVVHDVNANMVKAIADWE